MQNIDKSKIDKSKYVHVCTCSDTELTYDDFYIVPKTKSLELPKVPEVLYPYVTIFGEELRLNDESEVFYYQEAGVPIKYK